MVAEAWSVGWEVLAGSLAVADRRRTLRLTWAEGSGVIIWGWVRRGILLATKQELCATCQAVTDHGVIRLATILDVFWIPVMPLWLSHLLVCDQCATRQKLGWRQVRAAMSSGLLPLPPRPEWRAYARQVFEETQAMPREADLDRIVRNPKRGPWDLYLKVWFIAVPAIVAGLIVASMIP